MHGIDAKAPSIVTLELIGAEHTVPFTFEETDGKKTFHKLAGDPLITTLYLRLPSGRVIAVEPKGRQVMAAIAECAESKDIERLKREG